MVFIGRKRCETVRDFLLLNLSTFEELNHYTELTFCDLYNIQLVYVFLFFVIIF